MVNYCVNISDYCSSPTYCLQQLAPSWKLQYKQTKKQKQHVDEKINYGSESVEIFGALLQLMKKPVSSGTTCLRRRALTLRAELSLVITGWQTDRRQRQSAGSCRHRKLLRGSLAGHPWRPQRASWWNILAKSMTVLIPEGWKSKGIYSKWWVAMIWVRETYSDCVYMGFSIWLSASSWSWVHLCKITIFVQASLMFVCFLQHKLLQFLNLRNMRPL